jgi:NagD protein
MVPNLGAIRHVALDLDGTLYRGGTLFDFTNPFLARLGQLGIGHTFLTNNSSKSVKDYVVHLGQLGIAATREQIYTSTNATVEYLLEELPSVRRLFVVGTASMKEEIAAAGFTLAADDANDEPDAVLAGFDTGLNYSHLCRAAWWLKQGKPFIATHPDQVCPTDEATVLVDCGAICAALKAATGRAPDAVLGKPDPRMLRGLLRRHGLRPGQLAMVGDRLYTDLAMARRAGALGVLVLTGETTADEAAKQFPPLDLIVANIAEFGERLGAAKEAETR